MLIGIDANEANIKEKVGVNQYAFELLCSINRLQVEWQNRHRVIVYLKEPPARGFPKENNYWQYKIISGSGLWIIKKLMPNLFKDHPRPDVFFSPSHYLPPFSPMPRVCTIHDLGYLKFSEQFRKYDFWQLKYWSAYSIFVSKSIIAVSNSTKEDIVRHYPFASKKLTVIHHGYDVSRYTTKVSLKDVRRIRKKYTIVNDYLLFIGTLKPSKNIEGLLEGFRLFVDSFKVTDLKLVIAGKRGWLYKSIFKRAKTLGLEDRVIFTGYIDEEDKPALIKGAEAFVLAPFWEGFGMDVLNAMACGVPVVSSNVASLPEVLGSAGILINPHDIQSISHGLEKALSTSKMEYNKLVAKGLRQVQNFSWEKTGRLTIKLLESVGQD